MKNELIQKKSNEKGQIIVLLALSLVVVMMVAALAVDGGMIYSERRFAQNSADASSMAGGGAVLFSELEDANFSCPATPKYNPNPGKFPESEKNNLVVKAYNAAKSVATINNINDLPYLGYIVNDVSAYSNSDFGGLDGNHGVIISCTNPESGVSSIDVIVRVTSQISTAFAHLFYSGDLVTTNESIVTILGANSLGKGNAIISLSKNCKSGNKGDGLFINGSASINIEEGGMHSNSCLVINGNKTGKDNELTIEVPGITINDKTATINGNVGKLSDLIAKIIGEVDPIVIDPPPYKPDCSTLYTSKSTLNTKGIANAPGWYDKVSITNNDDVIFNPGIYCITGGFTINGGKVYGNQVTFYIQDGSVTLAGGGADKAEITLAAPIDKELYPLNYGILFYMLESNPGTFTINGNNSSFYSGLIYVPSSTIFVGGSSEIVTLPGTLCDLAPDLDKCEASTFSTQFIGYQVIVTGDGNISITYTEDNLPGYSGLLMLKE